MSSDEQKDIAPEAQRSAEGAGGPPDLDADALAAAAAAIARGERAIRELPPDVLQDRVGAGRTRRRDKILRIVLFVNLILMGVMVALPDPETPEPDPGASSAVTTPPVPPPTATDPPPQPRRDTRVPEDHWTRALALLHEQKYDEAAEALLEYQRLNPRMPEGQRLDFYTTVTSCLFKAGRIEEAEEYREKTRALVSRGYLPEDLLSSARSAWKSGKPEESRRYYARLLLQQQQLPLPLRDSIAEAYLRIGDSYRGAAGPGKKAKEPDRAREKGR